MINYNPNVAIITDTHWGARGASLTIIEFYRKFYDNTFFPELIENGIDTILMLGDTFDSRRFSNHNVLYHAKKIFFDRCRDLDIEIVMIVGNHDVHFKNMNDVNVPELALSEYKNLRIVVGPETIRVKEVDICFIPWICADNYAATMKEIETTTASIAMGHLEVAGFAMYRGTESHDGLSRETFKKFDTVFSGHYHHKSDNGHIFYLGNPYELTWQDYKDPRGFHFFNVLSRHLTFIQNPYTLFERFEYDDVNVDPDSIDTSTFTDKYVKVVVTTKKDFHKFDNFIKRIYARNPIEVKIIENFTEFTEGSIDQSVNLEDTSTVLTNYVDSIETDVSKDDVKNLLKKLYVESLNRELT